jgi:hypothetical protein
MSLRTRILRLIAGLGSSRPDDPDRLVDVATVEPYEAPILREVLAQQGIVSQDTESLTPGTWVDKVVVRVAQRDVDAATSALQAFRGQTPDGT